MKSTAASAFVRIIGQITDNPEIEIHNPEEFSCLSRGAIRLYENFVWLPSLTAMLQSKLNLFINMRCMKSEFMISAQCMQNLSFKLIDKQK